VKRVNIHEAKTNLSRNLAGLPPDQPLMRRDGNQPVAKVRPLPTTAVRKPRIGVASGQFVVPDAFFEPLPDETLKAFVGE
jgi:antitoxin (DNA-binding transcriptional repressor) of toxin-antitoxin stability system